MAPRMNSRLVLLAIGLLGVAAPVLPLRGDGLIFVPVPPPRPIPLPRPIPVRPHFPLEVTRHRVKAELDDSTARTRVEEIFSNPNDQQLEGVYLFPLPADAVVSSFSLRVGGREVTGEILERDRARQIYEDIVRQTRDPGLLEYVDRGLFRARVFPIPARGTVEVAIEYAETLKRDGGRSTYRYPLDTGKYSLGAYGDVLIDVQLRSSIPLRSIVCPSHEAAQVSRQGEKEARVTLEARSLRADRDLVLNWQVSEDLLAPQVTTHRGSDAEGYFHFTILPRQEAARESPPKDVVLVIDTSGSMLGPKLDQVKRALRYIVSNLNAADRFNIVEFSTEARRFRETLVPVGEDTRRQALAFVDEMKARGGTNLDEGLRFGLSDLNDPARLQLLIVLSDGEPTIGVVSPQELLRLARERNPGRRRVFVFGAGEDLNVKLLDALARDAGGLAQYVGSSENLEVPLASFYDKIDAPVLTDIRIEFPSGGVADIYPRPLPDLFRGDQLEIFGRYQVDGQKTIVIRAKYLGAERVFEYSLPFRGDSNGYLARLWAARKIGYLLEQMRLNGESRELKDEVIRLSKLHGIITPYTSYLILENDRLVLESGAPRPALDFRFAATDALFGGRGGGAPSAPALELRDRARDAAKGFEGASGGASIQQSRELSELKAGKVEERLSRGFGERGLEQLGSQVRRLEDRTFYLQGNRWVDSALGETWRQPENVARRIRYLSDEYFRLLVDEPGIGRFLSLGIEVAFLWKGTLVLIEG